MTVPKLVLLRDGKSVLAGDVLHPCGRVVWRALECFLRRDAGDRVQLTRVPNANADWGPAIDGFFARNPALGLVRRASREGSALNCRVVLESSIVIPAPEKPKRLARRPAPLGPDEVRALAARYARGEITREAMSRAFWRAPT